MRDVTTRRGNSADGPRPMRLDGRVPTEPPEVDPTDALVWAAEQVGEIRAVRRLTGGMTSTMLALETADQRVVLRLMTDEPWRTHGAGLVTRESEIQEMLAGSGCPRRGRSRSMPSATSVGTRPT